MTLNIMKKLSLPILAGLATGITISIAASTLPDPRNVYAQIRASKDTDTLYLCHMFDKVNLGSLYYCRVHTMPDGTRAIIEKNNTITPHLLDIFNKIERNPQRIIPTERIDETNPYVFTV
ncbi:MAG: hypothetical protein ACK4VI_01560 [Alphaproteobacteria bacterium]